MTSPKWALVTGGCVRIGAFINEQLAKQGWNLVLHFNQSKEAALKLQTKLESTYQINSILWQQDLSQCDQIPSSFQAITKNKLNIDLLINNASVFEQGDIKSTSLDQITNNMGVHLTAPWLLTQIVAQQEVSAHVINILDANLAHRYTSKSAYFISKQALGTLTELSAIELAPKVRINAIAFGYVLPPTDQLVIIDKNEMNIMQSPIALDHIINTLNYLQSNQIITGQVINLDGGSHLKCPPYMLKS